MIASAPTTHGSLRGVRRPLGVAELPWHAQSARCPAHALDADLVTVRTPRQNPPRQLYRSCPSETRPFFSLTAPPAEDYRPPPGGGSAARRRGRRLKETKPGCELTAAMLPSAYRTLDARSCLDVDDFSEGALFHA